MVIVGQPPGGVPDAADAPVLVFLRRAEDVQGHVVLALETPGVAANLEKAVEQLKSRSFEVATYILTDLRQQHWPTLTQHQQFRVLANLGHIAERKDGDYRQAAKLYLEAADADPTHERATTLKAVAHMNLGNRPLANELAEQAVAAAPNTALPHAVRARTVPDDVSFAQIEASVPLHLRDDAELAFALAMRAMIPAKVAGRGPTQAELQIAEKYVRAALAADPIPVSQAHLGMIQVECERLKAISNTFDISVTDAAPLRGAIVMLTTALEGYGKQPDPELHGRRR